MKLTHTHELPMQSQDVKILFYELRYTNYTKYTKFYDALASFTLFS